MTLVYSHSACIEHEPGPGHPERPARLQAVLDALEAEEFQHVEWQSAPEAEVDTIALAHPKDFVEEVLRAVPSTGHVHLDADTAISPRSGEAARRGAGAACAAVDAVMNGARNAFCATRPPGHHAEAVRPMGFCLFNNIVIAAQHARDRHGVRRVAVVDFDVHHGNGTQHMFEDDRDLLYASTHQMPLYPGTGARRETGVGNIFNCPMPPHAGSTEFRRSVSDVILPALNAFKPELLLVSAGFDAHEADPLANLRLQTSDFAWITAELMGIARAHAGGRLVSVLEGGYDLKALAASAAAHVRTLLTA
jgi:acetoin utilization deacetylase AcuC-like enzyme